MTPEESWDYFSVTFFHSAGRKIAPATAAAACVTMMRTEIPKIVPIVSLLWLNQQRHNDADGNADDENAADDQEQGVAEVMHDRRLLGQSIVPTATAAASTASMIATARPPKIQSSRRALIEGRPSVLGRASGCW